MEMLKVRGQLNWVLSNSFIVVALHIRIMSKTVHSKGEKRDPGRANCVMTSKTDPESKKRRKEKKRIQTGLSSKWLASIYVWVHT